MHLMVDMFLIVPDCPQIYGISVATLVIMLIAWPSCSTALSTKSVHCPTVYIIYFRFI